MLEHDHIALSVLVLHLGLERGAESIEEVAARSSLVGGEETDPAEARDDALLLGGGREVDESGDAGEKGTASGE